MTLEGLPECHVSWPHCKDLHPLCRNMCSSRYFTWLSVNIQYGTCHLHDPDLAVCSIHTCKYVVRRYLFTGKGENKQSARCGKTHPVLEGVHRLCEYNNWCPQRPQGHSTCMVLVHPLWAGCDLGWIAFLHINPCSIFPDPYCSILMQLGMLMTGGRNARIGKNGEV